MSKNPTAYKAYKAAFRQMLNRLPDNAEPAGGYLVSDETAKRAHEDAIALLDEKRAIAGKDESKNAKVIVKWWVVQGSNL